MSVNKVYIIRQFCLLAVSALLLGACSRDYLEYDTNLKDGIYLSSSDTVQYFFGIEVQGNTYDYLLRVSLMGMPSDEDRKIDFEIVDTATTAIEGVHYEILDDGLLKKGEVSKWIHITLIRDKDPDLTERPVTLTVRLHENENFRLLPGMSSGFTLIFSDQAQSRPIWWKDEYLGPYNDRLLRDFFHYYWKIEEENPGLYATMENALGKYLDRTMPTLTMWSTYRIPLLKYIVTPMYEYYEKNPDPNVKIPKPSF